MLIFRREWTRTLAVRKKTYYMCTARMLLAAAKQPAKVPHSPYNVAYGLVLWLVKNVATLNIFIAVSCVRRYTTIDNICFFSVKTCSQQANKHFMFRFIFRRKIMFRKFSNQSVYV